MSFTPPEAGSIAQRLFGPALEGSMPACIAAYELISLSIPVYRHFASLPGVPPRRQGHLASEADQFERTLPKDDADIPEFVNSEHYKTCLLLISMECLEVFRPRDFAHRGDYATLANYAAYVAERARESARRDVSFADFERWIRTDAPPTKRWDRAVNARQKREKREAKYFWRIYYGLTDRFGKRSVEIYAPSRTPATPRRRKTRDFSKVKWMPVDKPPARDELPGYSILRRSHFPGLKFRPGKSERSKDRK